MRISILTFCKTINYGAALQCYALSTYLKSLGHSVSIINLELPSNNCNRKKRSLLRRIVSKIIRTARDLIISKPNVTGEYERYKTSSDKYIIYEKETWTLFNDFSENRIGGFTSIFTSYEDIKDSYPQADLYIVGSDQVWNPQITGRNVFLYFFSFLNNEPRISYAASFGGSEQIDFGEDGTIELKNLLLKFNAISVRDYVGLNILKQQFNFPAIQVVDPTLLLDSKIYSELADESEENAKGYLYEYKFIINDSWSEIIKEIAAHLNLKVRSDGEFIDIDGFEYHPVQSIQGWLKVIKTADFVVSDSFHCTIFCILFKKQFITTPSYKGGEGRMVSLLKDLGIEDKFFYNIADIRKRKESVYNPIDYDLVYQKLDKLSGESKRFLIDEISKVAV